MDLNQLYQKHQLSLMLAQRADSREARLEHECDADDYAALIRQDRASRDADFIATRQKRPPRE